MACVIYVTTETPLPGGEKMVRGFLNPDSSWVAAGDGANLANYFKSASYPTVIPSSCGGYAFAHNGGTASAGTLIAYQNVLNADTMNGTAANSALYQVHAGANLSTLNVPFVAIGPAF